MNPFSDQCCERFRLGGKASKFRLPLNKRSIVKTHKYIVLSTWLLLGVLITLAMIPYMAVVVIRTRVETRLESQIGFLNAKTVKQKRLGNRTGIVIVVVSILVLPLALPLIYFGVLVYLIADICKKKYMRNYGTKVHI